MEGKGKAIEGTERGDGEREKEELGRQGSNGIDYLEGSSRVREIC